MHHFFPQPINSPSATSLPTKSRIITYSPFFSLHLSWFSETFFFGAAFSLKNLHVSQVRNGGAQPLQSHAAAWVEVGLEESWIQRSLAMGKTWVGGRPGWVRPQAQGGWNLSCWLLLASKVYFSVKDIKNRKNRRTTYCWKVRILAHQ